MSDEAIAQPITIVTTGTTVYEKATGHKGTVVQASGGQPGLCVVAFDHLDGTQTWKDVKDLTLVKPKKPGEILCRFCKKNATPDGICDRCSPAYWAGRREPRSGRTHKGIIADSLGSLKRQIPGRRAALNRAVDAFEERHGGTTMTQGMVDATRSFSDLIETYGDLQYVYARMEGPEMEPKQE